MATLDAVLPQERRALPLLAAATALFESERLAPEESRQAHAICHRILSLLPTAAKQPRSVLPGDEPASSPPAAKQPRSVPTATTLLEALPSKLLRHVLVELPTDAMGRLDCVSRFFHGEPPPPTVIEKALRCRRSSPFSLYFDVS